MLIGYILFALLGFALGYAAPGWTAWLALLVPIAFAALTAFNTGVEAQLFVALLIALLITAGAVVLGKLLDAALRRRGGDADRA